MIIFLDIDSVICTTLSTRLSALLRLPPEQQMFDPLALFWLRRREAKAALRLLQRHGNE